MFWRKKKHAKIINLKPSTNEQKPTIKKEEEDIIQRKISSIISAFDDKYGKAFTPTNQKSKNKAEGLTGDFCFNKI